MTVYRGYLKLIRRNYKICLIYVLVFIVLTFIVMFASKQREGNMFEAYSFDVAMFDQDGSEYSKSLSDYIGANHNIVDVKYNTDDLEKEMYNGKINYVVVIPKGFGEAIENGDIENIKVNISKAKNISIDIFFNMGIETYVNVMTKLENAFKDTDLTISSINEIFKNETEVEIIESNENYALSDMYYFFRYLPMLFISIFGYVIGYIMMTFKDKDLQNRCFVSGITPRIQNFQVFLALFTFSAVIYAVVMAIALIFFKSNLDSSEAVMRYALNALLCLGFSVGVSFLIGAVTKTYSGLNGLVNIVTNTFCFLGGVFIPMSIISPSIINFSKLLPTYWYELNISLIGSYTSLNEEMALTFGRNIGMQFLIMLVFLGFSFLFSSRVAKSK